jgi:transposase-like protein
MSKVDRNKPRRSTASESRYSIFEFEQEFPDDAACLDYLVAKLYPEGITCPTCERVTKHHRVKSRTAYSCQFCGHYEYPMVGTIFENSATSLKLWFYAIHLMASTRCGISAKQLEREIGVTYKTAWRMFNKIRSVLDQDEVFLAGTVEMDEMYHGGKDKWKHENKKPKIGRGAVSKTPVLGIMQRAASGEPGKVVAIVVPDTKADTLIPQAKLKVLPASTVYTDEHKSYNDLAELGYAHDRVNHAQGVYVSGDVHTNTIEGFWATVRRGIGGTYHSVSTEHLQSYLDEYTVRYNNRAATGRGMFDAILGRVEKAPRAV